MVIADINMIREEEFSWGTGTKTACSGNSSQNLVAERLQLELSSGDHDSSSVAPQGRLNEGVVVIIRVVFWTRWINHVVHPFALVRVVKLACIAPAVVGLGTVRRGWLGGLRRFRVCNVFQVLAVVTVRCLRGHEIAVAEGTPHWRSSRRCCGRLDLAGRVASWGSPWNGGRVVREIELCVWASYAHQSCVISVRSFFSSPEWAEPNPSSRRGLSDLRDPFPPSPHTYPSVLALWAPASLVSAGHDVECCSRSIPNPGAEMNYRLVTTSSYLQENTRFCIWVSRLIWYMR